MDLHIELTGISPLIMHNQRLSDKMDPITKEIASYTRKKKNMTEEDMETVAKLEWFGGLYTRDGAVVVPMQNIKRCFANAGKVYRKGSHIDRSLSFTDIDTPLIYDGPDLEKLYNDEYIYRTSVVVNKSRTIRVRPIFHKWAVSVDMFLDDSILDVDLFRDIIEKAGYSEGLGDNRRNGYGRFSVIASHYKKQI